MYSQIHPQIYPLQDSANIIYVVSFEIEFGVMLQESKEATLWDMQDYAIDVEVNLVVV
jgi:hypothetical protein